MKQILLNLALINLNEFCRKHCIDMSGTHVIKETRGFKYHLIKDETKKKIATVLFTKNTTPYFIANN